MATIKDLIDVAKSFRTQYDRTRVRTEAGNAFKDEYGSRIDKNGVLKVEKKGVTDMYNYIQSFADSCDINVLMKRFANGEVDVLNQRKGLYMDITNVPDNYADLLNKVIEGEKMFKELPESIRSKYNNNFNEWLVKSGTESWLKDMGLYKEPEKEVVVNAEKTDELQTL